MFSKLDIALRCAITLFPVMGGTIAEYTLQPEIGSKHINRSSKKGKAVNALSVQHTREQQEAKLLAAKMRRARDLAEHSRVVANKRQRTTEKRRYLLRRADREREPGSNPKQPGVANTRIPRHAPSLIKRLMLKRHRQRELLRMAMFVLYKSRASEPGVVGRHRALLSSWKSIKPRESITFDDSQRADPVLRAAVALAENVILEDMAFDGVLVINGEPVLWTKFNRHVKQYGGFKPEAVNYTVEHQGKARVVDERKEAKKLKQQEKAARTARRMEEKRVMRVGKNAWVAKAGRDMPDVETNPGPIVPVNHQVVERGATTGMDVDATLNNQYYSRPMIPSYDDMLTPEYYHDDYYSTGFLRKIIIAFGTAISDCCCNNKPRRIATQYVNFNNTTSKTPPTGIWKLYTFDVDTLHDPVDVVDDGKLGYLSRVTGVYTPWPCHARPTGRKTTTNTFKVTPNSLSVGTWSPVPSPEWAIYSNLRYYAHPTLPHETVITWSSDNTTFFKYCSEYGFFSVPTRILGDLFALYADSTHISPNSIATRLEMDGMPRVHADQLAPKICALLGGKKGGRVLDYFTMPTYNNGLAEANDPERFNAHYGTQEGPALLEDPAVLPTMSRDNDRAAVHYRINLVNPGRVQQPARIPDRIVEFATQFAPRASLGKIDREEVVELQRTAKTKMRMTKANEEPSNLAAWSASFVKKESYTDPKDTRNISGVNPEHNLWGFQYMMPIKKHLAELHWYGPGKGPKDVVDRLNNMMSTKPPAGYSHVVNKNGPCFYEGDYSRFDGTQCEMSRRIAFQIMRYWIKEDEREDFDKMIDAHFAATCFLPDGTRYQHKGSMLSGSWATTDANTILNAFCVFDGLREFGLTPAAAAKHVGQTFGDDGLQRMLKRDQDGLDLEQFWVRSTQDLGLRLEVIKRDNKVGYLSRWYEFGLHGVEGSVPDLGRLLPKFQYATIPEADLDYFKTKYSSLTILCGQTTPVLSAYLSKWFKLRNITAEDIDEIIDSEVDLPYWITLLDELNLVNAMFVPCTKSLADFCLERAAEDLKTSVETLLTAQSQIEESTNIEELYAVSIIRERAGTPGKFDMVGDKVRKVSPPTETVLTRRRPRRA